MLKNQLDAKFDSVVSFHIHNAERAFRSNSSISFFPLVHLETYTV